MDLNIFYKYMFFFALSLMRFMAYVTCFLLIIESYVKLKAVSSSSDLDRIMCTADSLPRFYFSYSTRTVQTG